MHLSEEVVGEGGVTSQDRGEGLGLCSKLLASVVGHWGGATEAEEDLQKQRERLGSQSWGTACFQDPEACFSDHNSLKVSQSSTITFTGRI